MVILLVVSMLVLALVAFRLALPALRRGRLRWELRGDWWSRFERELNVYRDRVTQTGRASGGRHGGSPA